MAVRNQRAETRLPVREKGSVKPNGDWIPCTVLNMSSRGFLFTCAKELTVGQSAAIKCELYPGQQLECKVEIRHVGPAGAGSKIIDIDNRSSRLCQLYLEEQYSNQLHRAR